jgi:hypothetical protein
MYFIEQINIHALGGTGSANIAATITDFIRSIVIIGILYGIGYASGNLLMCCNTHHLL